MTADLAPVIRRNTLLLSTVSAVNSVVLQLAAAVSTLAAPASCAGRGALPNAPAAAWAVAGRAHAQMHARIVIERRTTRA